MERWTELRRRGGEGAVWIVNIEGELTLHLL